MIWKLSRPAELSVQVRLIWLIEATVAVRLVGAPVAAWVWVGTVAVPVLEYAELPPAL